MNIKEHVTKMDEMVSEGDIVNAVKAYFSEDAATSDYNKITTGGKAEMVEKI